MNHRASKSFKITLSVLLPVTVALYFGLVPELEAMRRPKVPGDLSFPEKRPFDDPKRSERKPGTSGAGMIGSLDLWESGYASLMSWKYNPWKQEIPYFGEHSAKLRVSKDPEDRKRYRELRRQADAMFKELEKRYPELAVKLREVPAGRNGFLKLLELQERYHPDPNHATGGLPKPIADSVESFLKLKTWDAAAAKSWLESQNDLVSEIRSIGRMPERSVNGIDLERWWFPNFRFAKGCADLMLVDARSAVVEGDLERAASSLQASVGIADHIGEIETPSLLNTTIAMQIRQNAQTFLFSDLLPNVPPGRLDASAWENAVNPRVSPADDLARIMAGEWNVGSRVFLLLPLADPEDSRRPPDPEALLDAYTGTFLDLATISRGQPLSRLPEIEAPAYPPDLSYLSRRSQETMSMLWIGARAWNKGWEHIQSSSAMTQAAFALMQGQAVPNDPVYGLPYRWDPETRTLTVPDSPAFKEMDLKPIKLPKP